VTGRWRIVAAAAALAVVAAGTAVATERVLTDADGDGEVLTLLLLGSDDGPPRTADPLTARADGFQLLFVSADRQHATFVSIPRDSWVTVPGRGASRINACLNGGPDRCVATVEQEFGLEVDGYLLTSMHGFARAVQAFGGLTVDVPRPVYNGGPDIPSAGVQELSGGQALTYARDRKNRPQGDFERSQAQAELLSLGHAEVVRRGGLRDVVDTVAILRRHTVTDLAGPQLLQLGFEALALPPDNVQRGLAPARHGMAGPAAVVFLEPQAYAVIRDAAADGRLGD
jgi:polyisoprenyl-teichoic acid--peptidoglycan teichoic acid transferase